MSKNYISHNEDSKSPLDLYYNAWFNSKTDCTELDKRYEKALTKFQIILASSEISVYKICHNFHDKFNMNKNNIKTLAGLSIESYFDAKANHKYNMMRMDELVKNGILKDVSGKWVVIPKMQEMWTPRLAYLFYNELRNAEALGIIFYSEGCNNLGETLVRDTVLDVFQFPEKKYVNKRKLEDDNY